MRALHRRQAVLPYLKRHCLHPTQGSCISLTCCSLSCLLQTCSVPLPEPQVLPAVDQLSISPSEMRKAVLARIAHIEKHITQQSTVECIDMLPGSKLESSLLEQPDICNWAGVPPCRLWATSSKAAPGYRQLN